jgi:osmotically-inducible protein OsmY
VSLTGANRRDDDEIRGAALQGLIWDVDVPSDFVDVKVDDGWVTLKGNVSYQFESDAAYDDVASLYGVLGVTNEITVSNP